jgi:tRNA A37 threonylcarbamoyladenosine modification protein TsaB
VSAGPGGFTSVRIAITAAKMIAEATGAQCVAVPTALVAATTLAGQGPLAVALASKGHTAFVTAFDAQGRPSAPGAVIDATGLPTLPVRTLVADDFLPADMRDAALALGWTLRPLVLTAQACIRASLGLQAVDPGALAPVYPREPEAVTKWRALHRDSPPPS